MSQSPQISLAMSRSGYGLIVHRKGWRVKRRQKCCEEKKCLIEFIRLVLRVAYITIAL